MLAAVPVSLIGAALVLLPFADVMGPLSAQWLLLLGHGAFHCLRVVTDDNGAALHHLCRSVAVVVAGIGAGTPAGLGAAGRKPWPMGHLGGGRS